MKLPSVNPLPVNPLPVKPPSPLVLGAALAALALGAAPVATAAPVAQAATAGAVVKVGTAKQLQAALAAAAPGQTIQLADGTYSGTFTATVPGTAAARITLTGSAKAVLTTPSGGGYGLHLDGASYWTVRGLTVTGAQKGIMADAANYVVIDDVTVHHTTMEGVHFRNSSAHGTLRGSRIHDTGLNRDGLGEGVYVGTANTLADRSDYVQIVGNTFGPNIGAENVDLKEGTTGGLVSGNSFDGDGLTGRNHDDSWVDVKGNGYVIENNTGRRTTDDGYQTHSVQPGWGCGTVFRGNRSDLTGATGADRYAIDVTNYDAARCRVTIGAGNTVTGGRGLVNPGIPVR